MDAYFDQVAAFIETNQVWAGPIIGLLTFGESMLILGILIPATTILLLTGGLIGAGTLDPIPILMWGYLGAVAGDAISYWIGMWVGPSILRWGPLKRQRRSVARARLFFYRYGFVAVFLGRFFGPIRSTIPAVAGAMGMSQWRFQLANIFSAIVWVPALLLPGYLAARSVNLAMSSVEASLYITAGFSVMIGVGAVIFYIFFRKRRVSRNNKENGSGD